MSHTLVIGGGLSGCTVAAELAESGMKVTLLEKTGRIGGKVREYGCKSTDKCNNCGVCLVGGLWEKVEKNPNINIMCNSQLIDVTGAAGDFSVIVKHCEGSFYINGVSSVVVATGFEESPVLGGHLQLGGTKGIVRGLELEAICKDRGKSALFREAPKSVAFIQCVGSRDKREDSFYCSRVCCNYSTRAAKVIRHYYPDCEITFFYMELQAVSNGDYYRELLDKGIEFIKCRPLRVRGGDTVKVEFEDPSGLATSSDRDGGVIMEREFDMVMLSDGIHPSGDADRLAEICGLGQDANGFLRSVGDSRMTGIYIAGCAGRPAKIEESYSDSLAVARQILAVVC